MNNRCCHSASSNEEEEQPELSERLIPSTAQAIDHIEDLRRLVTGQLNLNDSILQALNKLNSLPQLRVLIPKNQ